MTEKIRRFVTCNVPVNACNFKCSYCYLPQNGKGYNGKIMELPYSIEYIADCFSVERMGGACFFNFCAPGETLLYKPIVPLMKAIIRKGHYCSLITNGVLSKKIDEIINTYTKDDCGRMFIKFSFHWFQLKEKNLLETFVENVNKIKKAGISYSIEITPHDELIPYIQEIKEFSIKKFGALPHITVARNEGTTNIELLTRYTKEDYKKIWSTFDSSLFDFKISTFLIPRKEFCYAGDISINLSLETGDYFQCFHGDYLGNAYRLDRPLTFRPIGKCRMPHCFNSHGYIALGAIPRLDKDVYIPTYAEERNRICSDGSEWLSEPCKEFISHHIWEYKEELTEVEKKKVLQRGKVLFYLSKINFLSKRIKNKLRKK